MPTELVEIGFDLAEGGPFLTLDDPIAGQLDNADWVLGGTIYVDVTDDVRSLDINRGKTRYIESISAGEAVVRLNNMNRWYDPTYTASPYYGNIVPKRNVRIFSNGIQQFQGVVNDWNLEYSTDGQAIASFVASDGFVALNNQTLPASTAVAQLSGARINAVLDSPFVNWSPLLRDIDPGLSTLGADVIPDDQNVLDYIHVVERSENGSFFVSKSGLATFRDRSVTPTSASLIDLADDGTGIPYQDLTVSYGSEDMANEIVLTTVITNTTLTVNDTDSQTAYGIYNLTQSDLILADDIELENLAMFLAAKFSQPKYRFDSMVVRVNDLDLADQNALLGLEIGDVVKVTFTPSGIPPAIVRYCEVLQANHTVDSTGEHLITFALDTLEFTSFVLDDTVFGKLDDDGIGLGY